MVALVRLVLRYRRVHVYTAVEVGNLNYLSRPRIRVEIWFSRPGVEGYYACDISVKGGGKSGFFSGRFHKT